MTTAERAVDNPNNDTPKCGHAGCAKDHCRFVDPKLKSFHDFRDRGDPNIKIDRFTPKPEYDGDSLIHRR